MGVIIKGFTVVPSFISLSESSVMISKGHVKSSLFTTGHVVSMVNLIQHFWHEMRLQIMSKAHINHKFMALQCFNRFWSPISGHSQPALPVHHPLEACHYSVVDEPHLSLYLVSPS
jgi:hypothetical protein